MQPGLADLELILINTNHFYIKRAKTNYYEPIGFLSFLLKNQNIFFNSCNATEPAEFVFHKESACFFTSTIIPTAQCYNVV